MKLVAIFIGLGLVIDGVLVALEPGTWTSMWKRVAGVFGGATENYFEDVVNSTNDYRRESPEGVNVVAAAEVGVGALLLALAFRSR